MFDYVTYYVHILLLIAPFLDWVEITDVLTKELEFIKLCKGKANMTLASEVSYIHRHLSCKAANISTILYYRALADQLCGPYDNQRRVRQKPGAGVTTLQCREYFAARIAIITGYARNEISDVLMADEAIHTAIMKQRYSFLDTLPDETKEYFLDQAYEELAAEIALKTGHDAYKAKQILKMKDAVREVCGEPG